MPQPAFDTSPSQPTHSPVAPGPAPLECEPVSAAEADWSRERPERWWDPPRRLLKAMRSYQRWHPRRAPLALVVKRWHVLWFRFWSVVAAVDIPINTEIGGGLLLTHPNGIVIHPTAKIGVNCLIFQQVTLVADVVVGGHVDIGAGAKILRPVTLGDHCKVGANAVVLDDVPPGCVAIGVPARVLPPPGQGHDQPHGQPRGQPHGQPH